MPEPGRLTVVKLGGSLMGADLSVPLEAVAAAPCRTVLVPGGGLFADAVRDAQDRLGFGDSLAHRLALRAMGAFAAILAERDARFVVAPSRARIEAAHRTGRTPVWDPVALEAGHPDIPENWDVTSDSLAAWLAHELGAAALLLLKSVSPAQTSVRAAALAAEGLVDAAFPAFAARVMGPIRCLGPADWPRLGEALARPEAAVGTAVRTDRRGCAASGRATRGARTTRSGRSTCKAEGLGRFEAPETPSERVGGLEARLAWLSASSS